MSNEQRNDWITYCVQNLGMSRHDAEVDLMRQLEEQSHRKEFDGYYDTGKPIGFI